MLDAVSIFLAELGQDFENAAARRGTVTIEGGLVGLYALAIAETRSRVAQLHHELATARAERDQALACRNDLVRAVGTLEATVAALSDELAQDAAIARRPVRPIPSIEGSPPGGDVLPWPIEKRSAPRLVPITDGGAPCR